MGRVEGKGEGVIMGTSERGRGRAPDVPALREYVDSARQ